MGVTKAHSSLQRECGLYDSPSARKIIAFGAVARAIGKWPDCFLLGLALLAFGGCSPQNLAAAKGEQDIPVHRIITTRQVRRACVLLSWRRPGVRLKSGEKRLANARQKD